MNNDFKYENNLDLSSNNTNVSNENMNSVSNTYTNNSVIVKKNNKKFIIPVIVLIFFILIGLGIILFLKPKSKTENNSKDKISSNENVVSKSQQLTKSKLSLYTDISDSQYLSVVIYDPLKDRFNKGDKSIYDKAVIVTYDLGKDVKKNIKKNGFVTSVVDSNRGGLDYYYSLTDGKYVLYQVTSTTLLDDGSAWMGLITKKDGDTFLYNDDSRTNISLHDKKYLSYGSNIIAGTNWYEIHHYGYDDTDSVNMKLGETETKDIFVYLRLNNSITFDDNFV